MTAPALSPGLVETGRRLAANDRRKPLTAITTGDFEIEIRDDDRALWLVIRRPGAGGLALRAALWASEATVRMHDGEPGKAACFVIRHALGVHRVDIAAGALRCPISG